MENLPSGFSKGVMMRFFMLWLALIYTGNVQAKTPSNSPIICLLVSKPYRLCILPRVKSNNLTHIGFGWAAY
jgi:hypothetical protein